MGKIRIESTPTGKGVFASIDFATDDHVHTFQALFLRQPNRYTIQIDTKRHLNTEGSLGAFFNHSCQANCRFDLEMLSFITVKPVKTNEELTFNYLTTEAVLAEPFECMCLAENCQKHIRGYRFLKS